MKYKLKNGKELILRSPTPDDAEAILNVIKTADCETKFLAREPGEMKTTPERERQILSSIAADNDSAWFAAEYEGEIVGHCSVGLVGRNLRFRHRAKVAFVLLRDCWGLGIGGKMMEECIRWCKEHGVSQIELDVIAGNTRAVKMYESFGFEKIGTVPDAVKYADGTFAEEYLMIKKL